MSALRQRYFHNWAPVLDFYLLKDASSPRRHYIQVCCKLCNFQPRDSRQKILSFLFQYVILKIGVLPFVPRSRVEARNGSRRNIWKTLKGFLPRYQQLCYCILVVCTHWTLRQLWIRIFLVVFFFCPCVVQDSYSFDEKKPVQQAFPWSFASATGVFRGVSKDWETGSPMIPFSSFSRIIFAVAESSKVPSLSPKPKRDSCMISATKKINVYESLGAWQLFIWELI